MKIDVTKILKNRLSEQELNYLIKDFEIIKTPGSENLALRLGKDSEYLFPKLKSGNLCHVHVMPIENKALQKWTKAFENNEPKVSDGVLIYVENKNNYLLIFFVQDGAHEMANMLTNEDKNLMNSLAKIANIYIEKNIIVS